MDDEQRFKFAIEPERIYDMTREVSRFLEGGIFDWPTNIQDALFEMIIGFEVQLGKKLYVVASRCSKDVDKKRRDGSEVYFVHVVLSDRPAPVAVPRGATKH